MQRPGRRPSRQSRRSCCAVLRVRRRWPAGRQPANRPSQSSHRSNQVGTSVFFDDPDHAETAGFLAALFEDELAIVLAHMEARRYADGELAVHAGERDRSIYVITEGRFEVLVPGARSPWRVLERGAMFGDLAFFDGLPRSADVGPLALARRTS